MPLLLLCSSSAPPQLQQPSGAAPSPLARSVRWAWVWPARGSTAGAPSVVWALTAGWWGSATSGRRRTASLAVTAEPGEPRWSGWTAASARGCPAPGRDRLPRSEPGRPRGRVRTAAWGTGRPKSEGSACVSDAPSCARSAKKPSWSSWTRSPATARTCGSSRRSSTAPCRAPGCWRPSSSPWCSGTSRSWSTSTTASPSTCRTASTRPSTRWLPRCHIHTHDA